MSSVTSNGQHSSQLLTPLSSSTEMSTPPSQLAKKHKKHKTRDKTKKIAEAPLSNNNNQPPAIKLNPSKIFYKIMINNAPDRTLFCIPSSELTEKLQTEYLKQCTPEDEKEGELTRQERFKKWKDKYKCPVFELKNKDPLEFHGITRRDFLNKYNINSLEKFLNKCEENDKKLNAANALQKAVEGDEETPPLLLEMFALLKNDLENSIKAFKGDLFLTDSMRVIWDSLFQLTIRSQPFDEEMKKSCSQLFLKYWEEIHCLICKALEKDAAQNYDSATKDLEKAGERLKTLREYLLDANVNIDLQTLEKLESIQAPLLKFLESIKTLDVKVRRNHFLKKFCDFLSSKPTGNFSDPKQDIDLSRSQLIKWLEMRAETLKNYLLLDPLCELFLDPCSSVIKALQERNWLTAYKIINSLAKELLKFCPQTEYKLFKSDSVINVISKYSDKIIFCRTRYVNFVNALLFDFNVMISGGKLLNPVSEVAYNELRRAYDTLLKPISENALILDPLNDWAHELSQRGFQNPSKPLHELKSSLLNLMAIQEKLMNSKELHEALLQLFRKMDAEDFTQISLSYSQVSKLLAEFDREWGEELHQTNQCIERLQDLIELTFKNPSVSKIDLGMLQKQFVSINQHLEEFIKPMTLFFYSFQQLLSDDHSASINSNSNTIQVGQERVLTLSQFPTDEEYFKSLSSQAELPKRKEWKPDSLRSHQNALCKQVQELINLANNKN